MHSSFTGRAKTVSFDTILENGDEAKHRSIITLDVSKLPKIGLGIDITVEHLRISFLARLSVQIEKDEDLASLKREKVFDRSDYSRTTLGETNGRENNDLEPIEKKDGT